MYLGRHGILTTSQGARIGYLSGTYNPTTYASSTDTVDTLTSPHYTSSSIASLFTTKFSDKTPPRIDIFISYEWPKHVTNKSSSSGTHLPSHILSKGIGLGSKPVAEIIRKLQPRYAFASSEGVFWEREPWSVRNGGVTRFFGLGHFGNSTKERVKNNNGVILY